MSTPPPLLSVVIPVFNEEELIEPLIERTMAALSTIGPDFEVICVDDGSRDQTLPRLLAARAQEPRLKVLALSRNFGHQSAYTAGLHAAKGAYVAMMDGDLQDPPEVLPQMWHLLRADACDIAYGQRTDRAEDWGRKLLIRSFHGIFRSFSRLREADNVGNFSMLNRKALAAFLSLEEKNRYLPGLRSFIGFRQAGVAYSRDRRPDGTLPKMGYGRLFALALDALFAFSSLPIKVCLYSGMFGIIVFMLAGMYVLGSKLMGTAIVGWTSLGLSLYFLGSIQLLFLGIIGEYVFRSYRENQNRPLYFIQHYYD